MEEKIYFLALSLNFEPPNLKVYQLYRKYKSFKKVFQVLEREFKKKLDWEKEFLKLEKLGIEIILRKDKDFPLEFKKFPTFTLGIFILGNKKINSYKPKIGIVGTRRATKIGLKTAKNFSFELSSSGLYVISGLAYGIDLSSHEGAIEARKENFAIIGSGIDYIFKDPRKKIIDKILEVNGGIISEYPPGSPPLAHHFPLRNRLIAALGESILIIEAPSNSGALITAKYAADYGKDVYVIPGSIYEKNYKGSLKLIQEGAYPVISPDDILEKYGLKKIKNSIELNKEEKTIIEVLENGGKTIDEILSLLKIEVGKLLKILTDLELKGLIFNQGGKFYLKK